MDIFKQRFGSEYTPLVGEEHSRYRIIIPFNKLAWFTVGLPFFGFLFCIIWSITYNFEAATSTHCQVYNVLPSISAAIGHFEPQKNVWKLAIALQAIIRAFIFYMYYQYYHQTIYKWAQGVTNLALLTYAIENISLFTLSFWTSNENYGNLVTYFVVNAIPIRFQITKFIYIILALHKMSFITFLITSFIHMIVVCYLGKYCRSTMKDSSEIKAYTIKTRAMLLNVISILSASYFFWKHNKYCEPLVYSLFALSEYMVVLTNMLFHLTAAWDFAGRQILISLKGIRVI